MELFRRRRPSEPDERRPPAPPPEELVRHYLRAQNLEQLQRYDEAIELYEHAVDGRFDSSGPYDRLIYIYRAREANSDIIRVTEAALANVRTFDEKRSWYRRMREEAEERARRQPDRTGPEF